MAAMTPFKQEPGRAAEARLAIWSAVPVLPNEAEAEQHELFHLPFRSWRRHCVRPKRKQSPHHEASPSGVSKFATDYMFMCKDGVPITILVGSDRVTKACFAHVVPCKEHESRVRRKSTNSQRDVHQPSESDPAERPRTPHHRRQTRGQAHTHIPNEIVSDESPVGDSNSHGSTERTRQTVQCQIRATEDFTERQTDATRSLDSFVLKWLV